MRLSLLSLPLLLLLPPPARAQTPAPATSQPAPASSTPSPPAEAGTTDAPPAAAAPACPPCNCDCNCPEVRIPLPASQDPARQVTGSVPIVVGDGGGPRPIADGPLIVTSLSSDCPLMFQIRSADGDPAPVLGAVTRVFVPPGASLEAENPIGFCNGTVLWSGYRP